MQNPTAGAMTPTRRASPIGCPWCCPGAFVLQAPSRARGSSLWKNLRTQSCVCDANRSGSSADTTTAASCAANGSYVLGRVCQITRAESCPLMCDRAAGKGRQLRQWMGRCTTECTLNSGFELVGKDDNPLPRLLQGNPPAAWPSARCCAIRARQTNCPASYLTWALLKDEIGIGLHVRRGSINVVESVLVDGVFDGDRAALMPTVLSAISARGEASTM